MTIALPAELADRRSFKIDVTWPVMFAFVALLCVLIVLPISWLIYYSITTVDPATIDDQSITDTEEAAS